MKVRIAGKTFDSKDGLIMLHLTQTEKDSIGGMPPELNYFAAFDSDQVKPDVVIKRLEKFKHDEEGDA